jgi:hypothetical protein
VLVGWLDFGGWDLQNFGAALDDDGTGSFLQDIDVRGSARQEMVNVDGFGLSEPAASADCLGHAGRVVLLTGSQEGREEEDMVGQLQVAIDQKLVSNNDEK